MKITLLLFLMTMTSCKLLTVQSDVNHSYSGTPSAYSTGVFSEAAQQRRDDNTNNMLNNYRMETNRILDSITPVRPYTPPKFY